MRSAEQAGKTPRLLGRLVPRQKTGWEATIITLHLGVASNLFRMHCRGIPVRDDASLSGLLKGSVISIVTGEDPLDTLVQRFQLTAGNRVSARDLDDYLSPDAKYFKMFTPFMRRVSRLVALKRVAIAYETYVYETDLNDWMENLERIGARRLPDERRRLKVPLTMERVLAESNEGEGAAPSQMEN